MAENDEYELSRKSFVDPHESLYASWVLHSAEEVNGDKSKWLLATSPAIW